MFSFDYHEGLAGSSTVQMGQPMDELPQRQQADHLPLGSWDAHGVERELQFADLEYRVPQAMG